MITKTVLIFLFKLLGGIIQLIFGLIDIVINNYFPDLDSYFTTINNFLDTLKPTLGFAYSSTLLPPAVVNLVVVFWSSALVILPAVWAIVNLINWFKKMKFW